MSDQNVETVRQLTGALQAALVRYDLSDPDLEAVAADFDSQPIAPDFELLPAFELPGRQRYRGLNGLVEFMRTWTEDFDDWSMDYEELIEAPDDRVVAIARQSGTGKGSGVPVELRFGMVFELKGGAVTRIRLFLEPAQALEAAGISK